MAEIFPCKLQRFRLRALRIDDLNAFHAYRSDLSVDRYQEWVPMTEPVAANFLEAQAKQANLLPAMLDRSFAAFLFDMDGTLLDSITVANRIWTQWANTHALDPAEVMAAMHGMQVAQTMRRFAPARMDIDREALTLTQAELDDVEGIAEIAGASRLLDSLPSGRWAIVTSAPRRLAIARLNAVGLPVPEVLITAEDVEFGKPAPDCYIAAAKALGVDISDCLIWEDAPAGVQAAGATGACVVIISATHSKLIQSSHPIIESYEAVELELSADGRLSLAGRRLQ